MTSYTFEPTVPVIIRSAALGAAALVVMGVSAASAATLSRSIDG